MISIFILFLLPSGTISSPVIDGRIDLGEWENSENFIIELNTGDLVNFSILYGVNEVYFLAIIDQSSEDQEIALDTTIEHDFFGIEFDNNKDNSIMGTQSSPDDTIIVNYLENNAEDMYMHSFQVFQDERNGGINNAKGMVGTKDNKLIFEISRPYITNDNNGYDAIITPGETYQFMVAFWDNQNPGSATIGFNKKVGGSQFIIQSAKTVYNDINHDLTIIITFILCLGVGLLLNSFDFKRIKTMLMKFY